MKRSFIFPGQASQYVGMALDLYDKYPLAKEYFETANDIMKLDLQSVCFNGPEEELKKTYITQPAIFVHSVIVDSILKQKDIYPVAVAGHSLGEYSALVSAGALNFESGLRLVKERSRLMHEAGEKNPGTMGAVIGLSPEKIKEICRFVADGIVQPANFNSPGQIAISGDKKAVHKVLETAKAQGAKRAIELVVSGAFHSPLMDEAQEGLAVALNNSEINDANVPVYTNVTSKPVTKKDELRELLLKQLTSPVLWQNIMENMIADGFTHFTEVGPGAVLKGLLKRIDRTAECTTCGKTDEIEALGE